MQNSITTFKDLIVWQKAHALVLAIYKVTKEYPAEERFGIITHLRRAASSIPTNIVEGQKRKSRKDFLHFLNLADSSLEETKYHIILSRDLNYISSEIFEKLSEQCNEVGRMLNGLQKKLNAN